MRACARTELFSSGFRLLPNRIQRALARFRYPRMAPLSALDRLSTFKRSVIRPRRRHVNIAKSPQKHLAPPPPPAPALTPLLALALTLDFDPVLAPTPALALAPRNPGHSQLPFARRPVSHRLARETAMKHLVNAPAMISSPRNTQNCPLTSNATVAHPALLNNQSPSRCVMYDLFGSESLDSCPLLRTYNHVFTSQSIYVVLSNNYVCIQ